MWNSTRAIKAAVSTAALLFIAFPANAQIKEQSRTVAECDRTDDAASCLLVIAKRRAFAIQTQAERAEALASVLTAYGELRREDPELAREGWRLLENPAKTPPVQQLNLNLALIAYTSALTPSYGSKTMPSFVTRLLKFADSTKGREKLDVIVWSCGLVDSSKAVWELVVDLVRVGCRPDLLDTEKVDDILSRILFETSKTVAASIYSDRKSFMDQVTVVDSLSRSLQSDASKLRDAKMRMATEHVSAYLYTRLADGFLRFDDRNGADLALSEALNALGRLDIGGNVLLDGALDIRVTIARHYISWGRVSAAQRLLQDVQGRADTALRRSVRPTVSEVDYLTVLAYARFAAITMGEWERRRVAMTQLLRQADILYSVYQAIPKRQPNDAEGSKLALAALMRAASAGHALAMYDLGVSYAYGFGVQKDFKESARWYSSAAAQGFAGAQNNLGDLFERGEGVAQSAGDAIYWYTQAAMQGEPTAYLSLGSMFANGAGVGKDPATAAVWLTLAVEGLPDGANKKQAIELASKLLAAMDERERKMVAARVQAFEPLRQTPRTISDKPQGKTLGQEL